MVVVVVVVVVVVYMKDMGDGIPDTKCKDIYCEVCRRNIQKLGWAKHLKTKTYIENDKRVEEVEKKQRRTCGCWRVPLLGEKMLHVIFAWVIGETGQRRMRRKSGT